jgi:hypothetical protein
MVGSAALTGLSMPMSSALAQTKREGAFRKRFMVLR